MSHSPHFLPNSLNLYLCLLQLFHDVHRVSLGLQWLSQDSLTPTQPAVKCIMQTLWEWQVENDWNDFLQVLHAITFDMLLYDHFSENHTHFEVIEDLFTSRFQISLGMTPKPKIQYSLRKMPQEPFQEWVDSHTTPGISQPVLCPPSAFPPERWGLREHSPMHHSGQIAWSYQSHGSTHLCSHQPVLFPLCWQTQENLPGSWNLAGGPGMEKAMFLLTTPTTVNPALGLAEPQWIMMSIHVCLLTTPTTVNPPLRLAEPLWIMLERALNCLVKTKYLLYGVQISEIESFRVCLSWKLKEKLPQAREIFYPRQ